VLNENGELLELLELVDMPSTPEANGRTATNAPLLAGILACVGFCEFVGARPTDAKVAAFAFGRARGVIETCAGALGSDRVLDPADMEATRGHSARRREQGSGQGRARSSVGRPAPISLPASAMSTAPKHA
jgi:crossover junction endodeoxyribonuclease RuvC